MIRCTFTDKRYKIYKFHMLSEPVRPEGDGIVFALRDRESRKLIGEIWTDEAHDSPSSVDGIMVCALCMFCGDVICEDIPSSPGYNFMRAMERKRNRISDEGWHSFDLFNYHICQKCQKMEIRGEK